MSRTQGDKLANYLTMLGHLCADINQGALSAILPFLVVGAGYSYLEATMLLFASNIASGIIQPLFGWLGDRHPCPWRSACFSPVSAWRPSASSAITGSCSPRRW